ncbi:MAG: glutaredoxin family protein [Nitrospirales bacterium]
MLGSRLQAVVRSMAAAVGATLAAGSPGAYVDAKHGLRLFLLIITLASCQDRDALDGSSPARHDSGTTTSQHVILYATSWCGYCQKAREFLDRNHIAYKEYDIEKSSEGRRQFAALRGSGVPLILVGNEEIRGWNQGALTAALARTGGPVDNGPALATLTDEADQPVYLVSTITPASDSEEHRYIIHFRDHRVIRVESYWEEGDELKYEKFGGIIGVRRNDVVMIEDKADGSKTRYTQR